MKIGIWQIATLVLAILLIISITINVRARNSAAGNVLDAVSSDQARDKAINVINNNLLQGTQAQVVNVAEESGMYKMTLNINDQLADVYISKDGNYLFTAPLDLNNPPQAQPELPQVQENISLEGAAIIGNATAPVTIVEFSDFECPFCGRFFSEAYQDIKKQYIDTGKARLAFRNFPLNNIHPNAQKAAEAAECANDQNKFWQMHDIIFENQDNLDIASLKKYAQSLNMSAQPFNTCLDSGKYADKVEKDLADGTAYGVTGTPTFFINGKRISGAQPFAVFKAIIDDELGGTATGNETAS